MIQYSDQRPPRPKKKLGQHFLHDSSVLSAIVQALGPLEGKTVIEIGPGRGALTDRLVERAGRVVAVELDTPLVARLEERYAEMSNVSIINADVLKTDLGALAGSSYVLAGNVPYYITTPILFHALKPPVPDVAVYLVQREVAERMSASPGSKEYGALSVNLQATCSVKTIRIVGAGSFNPPPAVESAVVKVMPLEEPLISPDLDGFFRKFVIGSFGLRRKQMIRVLRTLFPFDATKCAQILDACGVESIARPETLTPAVFAKLANELYRQ